jgi:hypothetical protein
VQLELAQLLVRAGNAPEAGWLLEDAARRHPDRAALAGDDEKTLAPCRRLDLTPAPLQGERGRPSPRRGRPRHRRATGRGLPLRKPKALPVREPRDSRRREDVVGRTQARHADRTGPRARCPDPAAPTRAMPSERTAEGPTPIVRSSGKRQTATRRDLPSRRSCIGSSASSSRPSWLRRDRETSQPPASSSRSFGRISAVACWRTASCACTATLAGSTAWFRSRASDAASARPAVGGAWPTRRRTSWTASSPRCRFAVAVGTALRPSSEARAAPRTEPGVRNYRTGLPPRVMASNRSVGQGC